MSTNVPQPQPTVSSPQVALIVYILYFVSYFTGITALIGVIIAYVQRGQADSFLRTHYQFQIRTFWIGILYVVVGFLLTHFLIGFVVFIWWFVWSLVRNIKGVLALNDRRPIADPTSWLFG